MPYYALSWVLTWFSHDFERFDKVARLFDIFISSSPLMPIYVASSVKCSIYIYIYIYIYIVYIHLLMIIIINLDYAITTYRVS